MLFLLCYFVYCIILFFIPRYGSQCYVPLFLSRWRRFSISVSGWLSWWFPISISRLRIFLEKHNTLHLNIAVYMIFESILVNTASNFLNIYIDDAI